MKTNNNIFYKTFDMRHASESRRNYIDSVNNIIDKYSQHPIDSYLDLGCGDGIRGDHIINNISPKFSTFVDPVLEVLQKAKSGLANEYVCSPIHSLQLNKKYDIITCLWNVFGHIETNQLRLDSLSVIYDLMSEGGVFIIDFNNRYNTSQYGKIPVLTNIFKDLIKVRNRGWYSLPNNCQVYIHSFLETHKMINQTPFKIKKIFYIDYNTGNIVKSKWCGQPLYILTK